MGRLLSMAVLLFMLVIPAAWGATTYQDTNRQTWFNTVTDKMATMGKNPLEARMAIQQRKNARRMARERAIDRSNRHVMQNRS